MTQKTKIMGIVNVTPDSFSDGGQYNTAQAAIAHGLNLLEEGADILDIGGESTRPNATIISVEEEMKRVIPVIQGLAAKANEISIDTRNAETMRAAIEAGATMVNDVSALQHDPDSVRVVAETSLPVCLMHMQGTPETMQKTPRYDDVIKDIGAFFKERIAFCDQHGISANRIILDPGIGFGKTMQHNLSILKNLKKFHEFGSQILLGTSRKSFIGHITGEQGAGSRLGGSIASALYALQQGVQIVRVHDVKETKQAFDVYQAILDAE